MSKFNYEEQAKQLSLAIDIAVKAFQEYPPKNWEAVPIQQVIKTYLTWKNELENSDPKYKNSKSFSFRINDVLTYFQEDSGETVNYFWQQINNEGLEYKRENKLLKIIKRKKIKSQIEYDFIIDVLVPYQQERIIIPEEVILLNKLLHTFELNASPKA